MEIQRFEKCSLHITQKANAHKGMTSTSEIDPTKSYACTDRMKIIFLEGKVRIQLEGLNVCNNQSAMTTMESAMAGRVNLE